MLKIVVLMIACVWAGSLQAAWYEEAQPIMGTRVSVELWSEDEAQAREAIAAVMAEMGRVDALMSPYKEDSEISRINRQAAQSAVSISAELFQLIDKALFYSRLSQGAFDISFASLGRHYQYREATQPSEQQRQAGLAAIDYRDVQLNTDQQSIRFAQKGMAIDLGGIAKGHAVDSAMAILQKRGITSAVIAAGGDSRVIGDRGDRPWVIGIKHPRNSTQQIVKIPLQSTALSTSGDYERFFIKEGVRYHHILDPKQGKSASSVQSVSILAPLAVDSDALSTTVFVLGVVPGLALINRMPGIDAIIIDAEGRLHYSNDLLRSAQ